MERQERNWLPWVSTPIVLLLVLAVWTIAVSVFGVSQFILPTPGAVALALRPGDRSVDELLATVGDGVLVQEVSGLHSGVNPVSGDVSVGAEGLAIRDGAPAEPFREATIASTLQRLLLDVIAVGSDFEWRPGGTGAPSLAIADVALGGA